jgi:putative glutamine amidotransferase
MRLSVVEVTRHRPWAAAYHSYVDELNSRAVKSAQDAGWLVNRIAAADVGQQRLLSLTDSSDAVIIMGGEDVAPEFYGGAKDYEGETRHFKVADQGQIALVHRALGRGTPLLGICRGLQVINIALGGDITQDLGGASIHKNFGVPIREIMAAHDVWLNAESRLAGRFDVSTVSVQSAHHQAVAALGAGLVAVGFAPDGVIEAIEHDTAPIFGVQWHPEDPGAVVGQLETLIGQLAQPEFSLAT